MSEFSDTMNDDVLECPYCKHSYQPEAGDYDEDERQEECDECGKIYRMYQSFSVTHHAQPDCELNGGTHNYQPIELPDGKSHPFCTVCETCQPHGELLEAV